MTSTYEIDPFLLVLCFVLWLGPNALPLALHRGRLKRARHGRQVALFWLIIWASIAALDCTVLVVLGCSGSGETLGPDWFLLLSRAIAPMSVPLISYALFVMHTGLPLGWRNRLRIIAGTVAVTLMTSLPVMACCEEMCSPVVVWFPCLI